MASTCAIGRLLEAQIPGLRLSSFGGGEELTRAAAALDNGANTASTTTAVRRPGSPRSPRAPLAPPPLPSTLPPLARQLLESPALRSLSADARTRELACAVARHAAAAADDPEDAEAQHHLALALQELSLRPGIGKGLGDEEDEGGWGAVAGAAEVGGGGGDQQQQDGGASNSAEQQQDEAASVVLLRAACGAYAAAARVLTRQRRRQRREQQQLSAAAGPGASGGGDPSTAAAAMRASAARSARADAPLQGPRLQSVHYNWGVALSTLATALRRRDPLEARLCLERASGQYAAALRDAPANPQALNNWALVLQELGQSPQAASSESDQQPPQLSEARRRELVKGALDKFRLALRARPDFDRGVYNLGTVYYTLACAAQQQQQQQQRQQQQQQQQSAEARGRRDAALRALYAAAGQYICLAHALRPQREVYRRSLGIVRQMLPLPFLRAGYLGVAWAAGGGDDGGGGGAHPHRRRWFVLDHASLHVAEDDSLAAGGADGSGSGGNVLGGGGASASAPPLAVALSDVRGGGVWRCADPSLAPGEALWVGIAGKSGSSGGLYLIAEDADSADAWVDALLLASHLARSGQSAQLAAALSVGRGR
jgi:hypothetical protein